MNIYEQYLAADDKSAFLAAKRASMEPSVYELYVAGLHTEQQRMRREAYPSFADQFDLMYHGGYDAWKVAIDAVKAKYPKPTE